MSDDFRKLKEKHFIENYPKELLRYLNMIIFKNIKS